MTYGEQIKKAREKKHLTQENLAEQLGVSRQAVSKWEADKSRPSAAKLSTLSETLDIPEEMWNAINEENQTTQQETAGISRGRKIATATLTFLLCLSVICNVVQWASLNRLHVAAEDDKQPADKSLTTEKVLDISEVFPETLTLEHARNYNFGDVPTGTYGRPVDVLYLKDEEEPENQRLWEAYFGDDTKIPTTFLRVVETNPVHESGTTFWDIYLLYAVADERGELDWNILYRLDEGNHFVNDKGGFSAEEFSNVLGQDGFKISLSVGVGGTLNYYITLGSDNTPCLMADVGGSGMGAVEFDVDEDGEKEIICPGGLPMFWTIYDTKPGEEGAFLYTLHSMECGVTSIQFDPAKGGFVVTDSQENVMVRYSMRGDEMVRLPMTDFTALDYPDVAGTKLVFDMDYFNESPDPDTVIYSKSGVRITPRQQAYLALQELYDLTGLKIEESYCAVSDIGSVCFSLAPDGFSERCFYAACLPEAYGGMGISCLDFTWQECGNDWSPLIFSELKELESLQVKSRMSPKDVLSWYYDRLNLFRAGEVAYTDSGELWLTNGDLYVGDLQATEYGPALVSLYGPYPHGEVNH